MRTGEGEAENEVEKELPLKAANRRQMILRRMDVDSLIEPDHTALGIWEFGGSSRPERVHDRDRIGGGRGGWPAYDPQFLISLWIYAYSEGTSSAREVARRCEYYPAYQWLAGSEGGNHPRLRQSRVRRGTWRSGGVEATAGGASSAGIPGRRSTGEGDARIGGRRVWCEQVMSRSSILGSWRLKIRRSPNRSSARVGADGERKSEARRRCGGRRRGAAGRWPSCAGRP